MLEYKLPWQEVVSDLHDQVCDTQKTSKPRLPGGIRYPNSPKGWMLWFERNRIVLEEKLVCAYPATYHAPVRARVCLQAKTVSSGYASFDYCTAEPEPADLVKVDISINGDSVDALSFVCHRDAAQSKGRDVAKRLKEVCKDAGDVCPRVVGCRWVLLVVVLVVRVAAVVVGVPCCCC